jgi:uncharacterized membrane protein
MKKYLFLIILICFLLLPNISLAIHLNLHYPVFPGAPDINQDENQNLNQIVAWFYYFIVAVAGLAAFIMLVIGGFKWLTSAGNPAAISDAKDQITKALLGLLIILASWLILQVINPELTILPPLKL